MDGARVCNNGFSGISYGRSDRVTVRNSQVFNNAGWQHLQTGDATPVTMPDGTVVRGYWLSLQNNVTVGDDWAQKDSLNKGWLFWTTTGTTRVSGVRSARAATPGTTPCGPTRSGSTPPGTTGTPTRRSPARRGSPPAAGRTRDAQLPRSPTGQDRRTTRWVGEPARRRVTHTAPAPPSGGGVCHPAEDASVVTGGRRRDSSGCARNQSIVARRPSSSGISGSQPSARRA